MKEKDEMIKEMGKARQIKLNFGREIDQASSRQKRRKVLQKYSTCISTLYTYMYYTSLMYVYVWLSFDHVIVPI